MKCCKNLCLYNFILQILIQIDVGRFFPEYVDRSTVQLLLKKGQNDGQFT